MWNKEEALGSFWKSLSREQQDCFSTSFPSSPERVLEALESTLEDKLGRQLESDADVHSAWQSRTSHDPALKSVEAGKAMYLLVVTRAFVSLCG